MGSDAHTCRVVVCDDVDAYRSLISMLLGFEDGVSVVGEAANGQEAIDVADREKPDVILLDVGMPVMDGIEALPGIRAAAPDCRVIMLTGFSSDEVRRRAMAAGASDYVEKGASPDEIIRIVAGTCSPR